MKNIKDTLAILTLVAIIAWLAYFNGCNREQVTVIDTSKEKAAINEANLVIDSLLIELIGLKNKKQPIIERVKFRNVYINSKSDTIKTLIKDSVVLAYVDTLETQIFDLDSLVILQKAEILKLDTVIIQKDTIINKKDLIIALSEDENKILQKEIGKQKRKIKGLKITAIAAPIAVFILTLLTK